MGKHVRILLLLFVLTGIIKTSAQIPEKHPFQDGEKLEYSVYYNLSWIWVDAARVYFSVVDSSYLKKKAIFFSSLGYSKSSYDWIFRVRDSFTSFANSEDITPLKFHRNTKEGSNKNNNYYLFDSKNKKIYSFIEKFPEPMNQDTLAYESSIYDILSATYYLRTIDFMKHEPGDTIEVNTVMDNEIIKLNVIYVGEETIIHRNTKSYPCYKFKTKGVEGSIFDESAEIVVWVSRDENKIPLMVESKIIVGSVKAYIQTIKKPKNNSGIITDFVIE